MNYELLKTELNDLKYSVMTDSQAASSLNTVDIPDLAEADATGLPVLPNDWNVSGILQL